MGEGRVVMDKIRNWTDKKWQEYFSTIDQVDPQGFGILLPNEDGSLMCAFSYKKEGPCYCWILNVLNGSVTPVLTAPDWLVDMMRNNPNEECLRCFEDLPALYKKGLLPLEAVEAIYSKVRADTASLMYDLIHSVDSLYKGDVVRPNPRHLN